MGASAVEAEHCALASAFVLPVLEILGARKTFDGIHYVFDNVNLVLPPGEFCVLIGPSGAGKSTLLRSISGLTSLSDGLVKVENFHLSRRTVKRIRQRLGVVHQTHGLIGRLSALQNVMAGAAASATPLAIATRRYSPEVRERASMLLGQVGIGKDLAHRPARTLSGGQGQRVGLARALIRKPALVLADEPVASLDPIAAHDVLSLLRDLSQSSGATVLCSLHQVDHARAFADRIIALGDGGILYDGSPSGLTAEHLRCIYGRDGAQ